jgi:hypothetical protein
VGWYILVISDTWEINVGGLLSEASLGQKWEALSGKNKTPPKNRRTRAMAQVVECLASSGPEFKRVSQKEKKEQINF